MSSPKALERVIELGQRIGALRLQREPVAAQLAKIDDEIDGMMAELNRLVGGGNGAQQLGLVETAKPGRPKSEGANYKRGSLSHRILGVLFDNPGGLTGASISELTKGENRQVHSLLSSRLIPAKHVERREVDNKSMYFLTGEGWAAYERASAKEGGSSDDPKSTAKND